MIKFLDSQYIIFFLQAPHNTVNYELESATAANNGGDAIAYFQINAATGEISLRQGLNLDLNSPSSYTVSTTYDSYHSMYTAQNI